MEQLILWFSILGFTFLFASLGATYVVYKRSKPVWLKSYLIYLALYAFFTIFNTYDFFSQVYLPPPSPVLNYLTIGVTYVVALSLLITVPVFVFSLLEPTHRTGRKVLITAAAGLSALLMILALMYPEWNLNRPGAIFMNGYLCMISSYVLFRIPKKRNESQYGVALPFLYLSSPLYLLVVLQSLFLPLLANPIWESHISLLTAGLVCLLLGGGTLLSLIKGSFRQNHQGLVDLSEESADRLGLTPREREIVSLMLHGRSNKEIGDELFVSTRTVEAHLYNVYKKCSVKNKLELARMISGGSQG